jgi:hypothetical protein
MPWCDDAVGGQVTLSWALNRNLPGPASGCSPMAATSPPSSTSAEVTPSRRKICDDLIKGVAFGNAAKVQRQIGMGLSSCILADVDRIERS